MLFGGEPEPSPMLESLREFERLNALQKLVVEVAASQMARRRRVSLSLIEKRHRET